MVSISSSTVSSLPCVRLRACWATWCSRAMATRTPAKLSMEGPSDWTYCVARLELRLGGTLCTRKQCVQIKAQIRVLRRVPGAVRNPESCWRLPRSKIGRDCHRFLGGKSSCSSKHMAFQIIHLLASRKITRKDRRQWVDSSNVSVQAAILILDPRVSTQPTRWI